MVETFLYKLFSLAIRVIVILFDILVAIKGNRGDMQLSNVVVGQCSHTRAR